MKFREFRESTLKGDGRSGNIEHYGFNDRETKLTSKDPEDTSKTKDGRSVNVWYSATHTYAVVGDTQYRWKGKHTAVDVAKHIER